MTTKTKKALGAILTVTVLLIIAFAVFVYIGNACNLGIAVEINDYISTHRSDLATLIIVTVIPTAMKYINQLNNKNNVILENLGVVEDDLGKKIDVATGGIAELKKECSATLTMADDVKALFGGMSELREREKTITDILLYYVLGNSGNSDIESLKLALQQSELLKNIRKLEALESESANGQLTVTDAQKADVESTLMSAKAAVKKAHKRVAL